jgi:hypothetical protein
MDPATLDWAALDRLRGIFLRGEPPAEPYWRGPGDLAAYDATFGERIGWKWDAVLGELRQRGWRPGGTGDQPAVLDWGCGSGVAGRRVVAAFGGKNAENIPALRVWDRSAVAREFSIRRARETFPGLAVTGWTDDGRSPVGLLVLSHVLNELPPPARTELRALIRRADAVLWVEPGAHAVSRELGAVREQLRGEFTVVAPCPHPGACGALAPGQDRHWCHFFAPPPTGLKADSGWVRFAQRAGVDLRSLPYAWLALDRRAAAAPPAGTARVLGRAEIFKGFARMLSCSAAGLETLELQKRSDPVLFKQLQDEITHPPRRWRRGQDGRVAGVE